jgi:2-polyprenyl-6-methoxyphenol hydroxylase-like FAD-dependent oxidoreductase
MAAAVALAQAEIDVLVYEQAQRLTEVGAGVWLAPNGLRMMERLPGSARDRAGGRTVRLGSASAVRRAARAARA